MVAGKTERDIAIKRLVSLQTGLKTEQNLSLSVDFVKNNLSAPNYSTYTKREVLGELKELLRKYRVKQFYGYDDKLAQCIDRIESFFTLDFFTEALVLLLKLKQEPCGYVEVLELMKQDQIVSTTEPVGSVVLTQTTDSDKENTSFEAISDASECSSDLAENVVPSVTNDSDQISGLLCHDYSLLPLKRVDFSLVDYWNGNEITTEQLIREFMLFLVSAEVKEFKVTQKLENTSRECLGNLIQEMVAVSGHIKFLLQHAKSLNADFVICSALMKVSSKLYDELHKLEQEIIYFKGRLTIGWFLKRLYQIDKNNNLDMVVELCSCKEDSDLIAQFYMLSARGSLAELDSSFESILKNVPLFNFTAKNLTNKFLISDDTAAKFTKIKEFLSNRKEDAVCVDLSAGGIQVKIEGEYERIGQIIRHHYMTELNLVRNVEGIFSFVLNDNYKLIELMFEDVELTRIRILELDEFVTVKQDNVTPSVDAYDFIENCKMCFSLGSCASLVPLDLVSSVLKLVFKLRFCLFVLHRDNNPSTLLLRLKLQKFFQGFYAYILDLVISAELNRFKEILVNNSDGFEIRENVKTFFESILNKSLLNAQTKNLKNVVDKMFDLVRTKFVGKSSEVQQTNYNDDLARVEAGHSFLLNTLEYLVSSAPFDSNTSHLEGLIAYWK
jgi:hypothetical protein